MNQLEKKAKFRYTVTNHLPGGDETANYETEDVTM